MVKKPRISLIIICLNFLFAGMAKAQQPVADYLNVPGPILFGADNYFLAWSAAPLDTYFKQQYLPKGDSLGHYNRMVLIDVLEDTVNPRSLVMLEVKGLNERKKTDFAVSYNLAQSPDGSEYILDFTQSEGRPVMDHVEWNAYRYKAFTGANGHKCVMLFGISIRSYGKSASNFIASLGDVREKMVTALMGYTLPAVKLN